MYGKFEGIAESNLAVGDRVLFDHFGGVDRPGRVVKLTKTAVYIAWTAPSSGIERVVPLSLKIYRTPAFTFGDKTIPERVGTLFGSKNVRKVEVA
jgi:hypothetical protein